MNYYQITILDEFYSLFNIGPVDLFINMPVLICKMTIARPVYGIVNPFGEVKKMLVISLYDQPLNMYPQRPNDPNLARQHFSHAPTGGG